MGKATDDRLGIPLIYPMHHDISVKNFARRFVAANKYFHVMPQALQETGHTLKIGGEAAKVR